jgi:predicted permease
MPHDHRWRRYLRFWKRDPEADVDDELTFHLAQRVEEYETAGMAHDEAVTAARARYGDPDSMRRQLVDIDRRVARAQDVTAWIDALRSDLRTSLRSLKRQPAFSTAVVGTLALGLGVNAAMFTFLDRVFLRPPAGVVSPSQIRRLWTLEHDKKGELIASTLRVSADEDNALTDALGSDAAFALNASQSNVRIGDEPDAPTTTIMRVAANYLPLLGVHAAFGRLFTPEEAALDAPAPVAVISDALWRSRFHGDLGVLGTRMVLSGVTFTIVGVTPPGFTGIDLERTDIWIPLGVSPIGTGRNPMRRNETGPRFGVLARIAPRTSDEAVEARATAIVRRAIAGNANADSLKRVVTGSIILARGPGNPQKEIAMAQRLGGVAIIVLLIACANIVNLGLARAAARRREIAVRVALGVSRARLAWLLSAPTLILAVAAGVAAATSAQATGSLLRAQLTPDVRFADPPIHWRVVVFTLLVSLVAGALSAIIPAIQASRPDVTAFLKAGAQTGAVHRTRLRTALVAAQAALSVVLLVGAGLFVRSVHNIQSIPLGYDVSHLAFAGVTFDDGRRPDSTALAQVAERIRSLPGVEQVAMAGHMPIAGATWGQQFYTATDSGRRDSDDQPTMMVVSPNYFAATGMRIVRGQPSVADSSWSIVVNTTMARRYWPIGSAIGQCIRLTKPTNRCYTVVGIAEDAHHESVIERPRSQFFVPAAHPPIPGMSASLMVLRADPAHWSAIVAATRRALASAFPTGRPRIDRLSDVVAPTYRPFRLGAQLFLLFGVLALVVAIVGVYGTVSYTVTQRTHEFGVRIALGASVADVVRLVVGHCVRIVATGAALGVAFALAAGQLIASLLYGVTPRDPVTIGVVVVALLGAAAAAAFVPAWRAGRVDPVSALRAD